MAHTYILFNIKEAKFAIDAESIEEILELPQIQTIPGTSPYHAGFINVRGSILPILDAKVFLGYPGKNYQLTDYLFVMDVENRRFGLVVTGLTGFYTASQKDIELMEPLDCALPGTPDIIYSSLMIGDDIVFIVNPEVLSTPVKSLPPPTTQSAFEIQKGHDSLQDVEYEFHLRALKLAQPLQYQTFAEDTNPLIIIRLKNEYYGIEPERVKEISEVGNLSVIPRAPLHIKGNMNIRGNIIPVIGIWETLQNEKLDVLPASKILVVKHKENLLGLLIQDLVNLVSLTEKNSKSVPINSTEIRNEFIKKAVAYDRNIIAILDVEKILNGINSKP